jgi:Asp-tRNA(Asn)/Glu-tRNA(Gln) amidotransferase B subunit
MVNELLAQLAHHKKFFSQNPVTEAQLGTLIDMVNDRKLTGECTWNKPLTWLRA